MLSLIRCLARHATYYCKSKSAEMWRLSSETVRAECTSSFMNFAINFLNERSQYAALNYEIATYLCRGYFN